MTSFFVSDKADSRFPHDDFVKDYLTELSIESIEKLRDTQGSVKDQSP